MSKSLVTKFMVATPLLAVAVLALFLAWGHSFSNQAEAAGTATAQLVVPNAVGGSCSAAKCSVVQGTAFTLRVDVTAVSGGFSGIATEITYPAGILKYKPGTAANEIVWPPSQGVLELRSPAVPTGQEGAVNHAAASAILPPRPTSATPGPIVSLQINCTALSSSGNTVSLVAFDAAANTDASGLDVSDGVASKIVPISDTMQINCIPAPTNTPVPPTNTPPANPQMQKTCLGSDGKGPATSNLCNLFMTRQGSKLPPLTCAQSTSFVTLTESLSIPIPDLPDPKGDDFNGDTIVDRQALGAFEFEVHFDDSQVCVNILPGAAITGNSDIICFIEDKTSAPTLEGVARIGCVTRGKSNPIAGLQLATIVVRPQPEQFNEIKPNQDNGNVVQIQNVGCEIADLQGHPIALFSCEDAEVTIRFLEGDVEPDCTVNALDTQAIAFRWGVQKGSLIYWWFMNLEPSGPQADNDIDIKDLQFVFGRFGSTCKVPWPAQVPVNPKA